MLIFIWNLLLTHLIFHFKYCIFGLLYFYALFFSFHLSPFFSPWILFLAILLKVLIIYLCHVCICLCWLTCSLVMGHIFLIITRNFWFDIAYCEYYIVELWILISSLKILDWHCSDRILSCTSISLILLSFFFVMVS